MYDKLRIVLGQNSRCEDDISEDMAIECVRPEESVDEDTMIEYASPRSETAFVLFTPREGRSLKWNNVNMTLVSDFSGIVQYR